jgi:hypothetical protein
MSRHISTRCAALTIFNIASVRALLSGCWQSLYASAPTKCRFFRLRPARFWCDTRRARLAKQDVQCGKRAAEKKMPRGRRLACRAATCFPAGWLIEFPRPASEGVSILASRSSERAHAPADSALAGIPVGESQRARHPCSLEATKLGSERIERSDCGDRGYRAGAGSAAAGGAAGGVPGAGGPRRGNSCTFIGGTR